MTPSTFDKPDEFNCDFLQGKEACELQKCTQILKVRILVFVPRRRQGRLCCWWIEEEVQNAEQMVSKDSKEEQWAEIGARKNVQACIRPKAKEYLTQTSFYLKILMNRRYALPTYRGCFFPRAPGRSQLNQAQSWT